MSPVVASPWEKPVCTGGPSGNPVRCTSPLRASPIFPKPGALRLLVRAP